MGLSFTLPTPVSLPAIAPIVEATRDVYGYDVGFRSDFLITAGGDYVRVGGVENVKQAIYRRLITRPGEFRFRPTYGVGIQDFVKKPPTKAVLDTLRQRIVDQLSLDVRLAEVDVTVASDTVQGVAVIKVYVKAVVGGGLIRFEPLTFAKEPVA